MSRHCVALCLMLAACRRADEMSASCAASPPVERTTTALPWATLVGNDDSFTFGERIVPAGDLDGDGWGDLVVASSRTPATWSVPAGAIWLFRGGPEASTEPAVEVQVPGSLHFGSGLAAVGDVDGDGRDDVLVGDDRYGTGPGVVHLFHGANSLFDAELFFDLEGPTGLGSDIAGLGDNDDDGHADVAIVDAAGVGVYVGISSGLAPTPAFFLDGPFAVEGGDIDGDGLHDLITWGASGVRVSFGDALGGYDPDPVQVATAEDLVAFALAGDLDGDGAQELALTFVDQEVAPRVEIFAGSRSPTRVRSLVPDARGGCLSVEAATPGTPAGHAGDLDGDGFDDLFTRGQATTARMGEACIYRGGPEGVGDLPSWVFSADGSYGSAAGDFDGDGRADLALVSSALLGSVRVFAGCVTADADGDGHDGATCGGYDCDDTAPSVYVGADDAPGDGIDGDCDGWDLPVDPPGTCDCAVEPVGGQPSVTLFGSEAHPTTSDSGFTSSFGVSVDAAGDVDGDGFGDLVVGAYTAGSGLLEGAVDVYRGSARGLTAAVWATEAGAANSVFGQRVSSLGDFDGDGFDDLAAQAYDGVGQRATILLGGPVGLTHGGMTDYLGGWVGPGDLDGDGLGEIVLRETEADVGVALTVYTADRGGAPIPISTLTLETATGSGNLGRGGDVDGDGRPDVIATWTDSEGNTRIQAAFGGVSGLSEATLAPIVANAPTWDAVGVGDIDGDGFDDVAYTALEPGWGTRSARIHGGSPGGLSEEPLALAHVDWYDAEAALAGGDLDGDGYAELAVSRARGDAPGVAVLCGGSTGPSDGAEQQLSPSFLLSDAPYGLRAGIAGDLDGDGSLDLWVSGMYGEGDAVDIFSGVGRGVEGGCATSPRGGSSAYLVVGIVGCLGLRRRRAANAPRSSARRLEI